MTEFYTFQIQHWINGEKKLIRGSFLLKQFLIIMLV